MNIFEGARRILYAATAVAAVAAIWAAATHEPYIEAGRFTVMPSGEAKSVRNCPNDSMQRVNAGVENATVIITLCDEGTPREVTLSPVDLAKIKDEISDDRMSAAGRLVSEFAMGIAALWIASVLLGWILRGFMGIPRGMDTKS